MVIKRYAVLSVCLISLVGCSTPKTTKIGEGVVKTESKVKNPPVDQYKKDTAIEGTKIGLGTGAVVGGVVGGGVGFVAGTL